MDYFPLNWGKQRAPGAEEHNWLVTPGRAPVHPTAHENVGVSADYAVGGATTHTSSPVVTGTSVVAIKYKDGVMMATDCLASYGSLARFRDMERMTPVGDYTVVGGSGDVSDFAYIKHQLETLMIEENEADDGHALGPVNVYEYLHRVMYHRRSKFNFLWNTLVVGGIKDGEKFLGCVDMKGVTYSASTIATGFGAHLAQPILRKAVEGREDTLTEDEARKIIHNVMRVLFYRDARSINKFQVATVNDKGVTVSEPMAMPTEWGFAESIRGYGANQP
ncbi:Proteasome subunit beta type-7 [Blastocladiella emersonii ATCC 22665]|nr:Proteasome subunit beta type-7 [Blastocladiella emersonii ATCC 22665]